jgi:23S rRNA (uracil1939-C5)-methyltransferase
MGDSAATLPASGPVLRLEPHSMAAGGDAVARDTGGRVVLVEGALPGEVVDAAVYDQRAGYARARVVAVLRQAPGRAEPPCPHVARGCGGCGWQHISPGAQVELKMAVATDALRRLGGVREPKVRPGPALPSVGYRTILRVAVVPGAGPGPGTLPTPAAEPGRVGFRRHRRHDVVEVDSCLVAHPLLARVLRTGNFGRATEAVLRCGARTGQALGVLSPTATGADLGPDVRAVGSDELGSGRRAWIFEEIAGTRLRVSAESFFQARPDGAEVLVELVAGALADAPAGPMVDAYGGVGLFAATVGPGRSVTIVEISPSAAADARVNVPGARVRCVGINQWRPQPAAAVVADPPRAGLGTRAAAVLAATGATHLALVSCDPASLGRDTAVLSGFGFNLESTTVVDMFPGTPHIEAVSRFVR